jgi:hypothetical protein
MDESKPRYNIALLPVDPAFVVLVERFAQDRYGAVADGYLLGNGSLPHVTLCQFDTPDAKNLETIFAFVKQVFPEPVAFRFPRLYESAYYTRTPPSVNAGLALPYSAVLHEKQRTVADYLAQYGHDNHTQSEKYFPHMTCARIPLERYAEQESILPPQDVVETEWLFKPSIGVRGPYGTYPKVLSV